ncbi:MAG: phage tail protein [Brevundimonas sp.]
MINFSKGPKQPTRTPDSLTSDDTVELLIGLSEGPIKGLANGPRDVFLDDTPLVSVDDKSNFSNFALDLWPGDPTGHIVELYLGGASSPTVINQALSYNVPVTRQGGQTNINTIDVRFVIARLLKANDKGTFKQKLDLKIEIKRVSEATWRPAWYAEPPVPGTTYTPTTGGGTPDTYTNSALDSYLRLRFGDFDFNLARGSGAPTGTPRTDTENKYIDETDPTGIYSFRDGLGWVLDPLTPGEETADGRMYFTGSSLPASPSVGDLWSPTAGVLYIYNGHAFVTPGEYYSDPGVSLNQTGIWSIEEKTSSSTPKDLRIFVEAVNEPYQLRVTKLTQDSTEEVYADVTWESIQEIVRGPLTFEGVATMRVIGRGSDQFTGVPNVSQVCEGRIVKVPTNYDAVARTYSGVWDGTYKLAYTNNTAWILQDFIENTTYGLSSVYPHTVNKWKFYEFAQFCDTMVERPDASLRPRWTFNDYITDQRDATELAQYIAGSAGARVVDDGNGFVDLIIDRADDPATILFTPENVSPDGFEYTYTDRFGRANEVFVNFINPDLNWLPDKRRIADDDDISDFGKITDDFVAVGCIDVDEAMARGRRRLISGLTEKEIVSFKTNRQGKYVSEWDVCLVADPKMSRALTGRIRSQPTSSTVTLRDPITLETGFTYKITFTVPTSTGFVTVESTITTPPGTVSSLAFTPAIPDLPPYANFSIAAANVGFPKPYRILTISDDGGDGEVITITAQELNRNKQAYIDSGSDTDVVVSERFDFINIEPPADLDIAVRSTGNRWLLEVTWPRSTSRGVRSYEVQHFINDKLANTYSTSGLSLEVSEADEASHLFMVRAVSPLGNSSQPIARGINLSGVARIVPAPINFRVAESTLVSGVWQTSITNPTLEWDEAPAVPGFSHYLLKQGAIEIPLGSALRYQFLDTSSRTADFELYTVNLVGERSVAVPLSLENAAPAAPTVTLTPAASGIVVDLSPPGETDIVGAQLIVATSAGSTVVTHDANQSSFFLPVEDGGLRYVKAAYYDNFGKTGLNWSTEQSERAASTTSDTTELLFDETAARFDAHIAEENRRRHQDDDKLDRFDVLGDLNPVDRTAVLRGDAVSTAPEGLLLEDVSDRVGAGLSPWGDVALPIPTPVSDDSGLLRRFGGGAGGVAGQLADRNIVTTPFVEVRNITRLARYESASEVPFSAAYSGPVTTNTNLFQVSLTATGETIVAAGKFLARIHHSQDNFFLYISVWRQGATGPEVKVFDAPQKCFVTNGDGFINGWQCMDFSDTPPAGATTYYVRARHSFSIGGPGAFEEWLHSNRTFDFREHLR